MKEKMIKRLWLKLVLIMFIGFSIPGYSLSSNPGAASEAAMKKNDQASRAKSNNLLSDNGDPATGCGSSRFDCVMGGAAVLDHKTGLVWEQSPDTTLIGWPDAYFFCLSKVVGGQKGWRLPTVKELASLVDTSVTGTPKLPSGHPFNNVQSAFYWSATAEDNNTIGEQGVSFAYGGEYFSKKTSGNFVWCVLGRKGDGAS